MKLPSYNIPKIPTHSIWRHLDQRNDPPRRKISFYSSLRCNWVIALFLGSLLYGRSLPKITQRRPDPYLLAHLDISTNGTRAELYPFHRTWRKFSTLGQVFRLLAIVQELFSTARGRRLLTEKKTPEEYSFLAIVLVHVLIASRMPGTMEWVDDFGPSIWCSYGLLIPEYRLKLTPSCLCLGIKRNVGRWLLFDRIRDWRRCSSTKLLPSSTNSKIEFAFFVKTNVSFFRNYFYEFENTNCAVSNIKKYSANNFQVTKMKLN